MILTVTLNAALDVTYQVPSLVPHASHRVTHVHARAGGKGVNVARVLAALGHPVLVTGLAGGATGEAIRADLAAAGLTDALVPTAGTARRTTTVVAADTGDATVFNEPGPLVSAGEYASFRDRYRDLLGGVDVVALSGSLPPGVPDSAYADLVAIARAAGVRTVLDTSGPALRVGLAARPDVVKPNAAELADLAGPDPLGDTAVVASYGPDGLVATTAGGVWRARVPTPLTGNPTGAGDSVVAVLCAGLAAGRPWPDLLREAAAVSAAAVVAPFAGDFDADTHRRVRPTVLVEEVHAPGAHR